MDLSGLPDCLFLSQIAQHLDEVLLQFSCLCPSAVSIQVFLWVPGLTKPNHGSGKHKPKEAGQHSCLRLLSTSAGTKRKGYKSSCSKEIFQKMKVPTACLHSIDFLILMISLELELMCLLNILSNSEIQWPCQTRGIISSLRGKC